MAEERSILCDLRILLGVSGGIAAYKIADLASKLTSSGGQVKTVMTSAACQLVGPKTFEAVTQSTVFTTLWSSCDEYKSTHTGLSDWAQMVVVAPATANIIAKMALGISDDLLSTTLLACWQLPTLIAPAMNEKMWQNPAVQNNIKTLKDRGVQFAGPEVGRLACGTSGIGRMAEPEQILEVIKKIASKLINDKN